MQIESAYHAEHSRVQNCLYQNCHLCLDESILHYRMFLYI